MTPEKERISDRSIPGYNPGVDLLRKTLSSGKDAEDGYRRWRSDPYTKAFLGALAELADTPPFVVPETCTPEKIMVQYGMTAGLSLAFKLLAQPNRVFPEVFRGDLGHPSYDGELGAYTDSQDSVLDQM